jgi:hypothetical protein
VEASLPSESFRALDGAIITILLRGLVGADAPNYPPVTTTSGIIPKFRRGMDVCADADWIATVLAKVRQRNPEVPETVWVRVDVLLRGRFSVRPIPVMELKGITEELIADIVSSPPPESGREP